MIEILDNYKGQSEKNRRKYDSDYRAILSWVVERFEEEQGRKKAQPAAPPSSTGKPDTADDWQRFYREGYSKK